MSQSSSHLARPTLSREICPGDRFGRYVAVSEVKKRGGRKQWLVRCECGTEKETYQFSLLSGGSQSCGCLKRDKIIARQTTHGMSKTSEFQIWFQMKERCLNPKHPEYVNYGLRGIGVFGDWIESFQCWLSHIGQRPSKKHSLDRIDNSRGYEPGNVRWATQKEQTRNMRRNVIVEHEGKQWCFTDLASHLGINANTARVRMCRGKTPRQALDLD